MFQPKIGYINGSVAHSTRPEATVGVVGGPLVTSRAAKQLDGGTDSAIAPAPPRNKCLIFSRQSSMGRVEVGVRVGVRLWFRV